MIIIAYLLILVVFVIFFIALYPKESDVISVFGKDVKDKTGTYIFEPVLAVFAPLNELILKLFNLKEGLQKRINIAKLKIKPVDFLSLELIMVILGPLLLFLFGVSNFYILLFFAFFFFALPLLVLNSKVKNNKYAIARILPETVDLLALCVGAGLDFMAAVKWVVDKVTINPLISELIIVLREINMGKSRSEALKSMAWRLEIPDVTSFVRTLIQADKMGTPVEEAFKILSEDVRMRRFHRGERQAMKAPLKMLIPLIFCILPVILIIVAGPILIRFMQGDMISGF